MSGIFKAYDIRGVVDLSGGEYSTQDNVLSPTRAYLIGRGLAAEVFRGAGPIVVSRDMRLHSPTLAAALIHGLAEGGCAVLDIGLAATPMNYWANVHYKSSGSVTVTASHNGPEYNGFKVSGAAATPVDYLSGLDRVETFVRRAETNGTPVAARPGTVTSAEGVLGDYLDFMDAFLAPGKRPLKIAVDAANGMAGLFLAEFFARHDWLEAVPLYWELDGSFPNHEADPLKPENLLNLQQQVKMHGCDFGVAFDGDADRCMFVDERGVSIASDLTTALIAAAVLAETPGGPILYDLRSSRVVPEWITEHGGIAVRGRVGHSFMKRLLRQKSARFGGELSGHYYFADCFHTDSGLMAMIQVINIWQQQATNSPAQVLPLSQMIAPLRRYSATGELNFHVSDVPHILSRVEHYFSRQGARLDHLDGLTVDCDGWWFNLRPSNTEPLLRLNLEAATAPERESLLAQVKELIAG
ncbi:MAG TPA: phosphomannomutase/phosphoglucomutase [Abditibacteriaceae bacterium]|nr:phosphomannomutase/phosphoglucomutase [Abditibacteriaceae bacterium]